MPAPAIIWVDGRVIAVSVIATIAQDGTGVILEITGQPVVRAELNSATVAAAVVANYATAVGAVMVLTAPTLISIVPNSCVASAGTTFYVTGTNMAPGGMLTINGVACSSPAFENPAKVDWSIYGGQLTAGGPYDVVYTGPDGQTATLAGAFTAT